MPFLKRPAIRWVLAFVIPVMGLMISAFMPLLPPPPPGLQQLDPMEPFLYGIFPAMAPTGNGPGAYELENAFPQLTFIDPIQLAEIPAWSKMLVLGKNGQLWSFDKRPDAAQKTTVLDIVNRTLIEGDGGALGMALHPEFAQPGSPNRGFLYLWYRYAPSLDNVVGPFPQPGEQYGYLRLSRFTWEDGATTINPASELVMIQQFDRNGWHNGGGLAFGPDGFLYVSIGDEGSGDDAYDVTQRLDYGLFGGILRIDADQQGGTVSHPIRRQPVTQIEPPAGWPASFTQGYFIPSDNPWLNDTGVILEEFYAIGLRSPHRISYDEVTGDIWVGDVGQTTREELSIIRKGDNLQWPFREGTFPGPKGQPENLIGTSRAPVFDYGRDFGVCVIGGFVYRGDKFPDLKGNYLFADHATLNVYTLTPDSNGLPLVMPMLNVPYGTGEGDKAGVSSFGQDSEGNVYLLKLNGTGLDGGLIYQLKPKDPVPDPPALLSEIGAFRDLNTLEPAPGLLPYAVNTPLWSDRAAKHRWIALPHDGQFDAPWEKVGFQAEDNWNFPAGTVFIKHFELPLNEQNPALTRRLETRFFVITEQGGYGLTYRWNDEGTEAYLLGTADTAQISVTHEDGSTGLQTWEFPSRQQCLSCHNANAGSVLGVRTRQINGTFAYPTGISSNQLETWSHLGIFNRTIEDPAQFPASAPVQELTATEEFRVRSYLDANCAFCHRPNGVPGAFDARSLTALYDQQLIRADAVSHASVPGHIIEPGDLESSILFQRDNSLAANAMPPIAKNIIDESYIGVLTNWITTIPEQNPVQVIDGWYYLEARHSGKRITIMDANEAEGAAVAQLSAQEGEEANHQRWHIQHLGGNKYRLLAGHSLMALSPMDWRSARGAEMVQRQWSNLQHQIWYFHEIEPGYFAFVNAYNGMALDVFGGQTSDQARLITWTPTGAENQQWRLIPTAGPQCGFERTNYLSDLDWIGIPENGWGPVSRDRSNGELGATDGNPLTIAGEVFAKGIGAHSYSRIEYEIGGKYDRFLSIIGVDDETGDAGSVQFQVWGDGRMLYESPVMHGYEGGQSIELPIKGVRRLALSILDGGDGAGSDHGNWAMARLVTCEPPLSPANIVVYPNPTTEARTIWVQYLQPEHTDVQINVLDLQGRLVRRVIVAEERRQGLVEIPLSGIGAGVYLLQVMGADWSEVRKIVVR